MPCWLERKQTVERESTVANELSLRRLLATATSIAVGSRSRDWFANADRRRHRATHCSFTCRENSASGDSGKKPGHLFQQEPLIFR